MMTGNCQHVCRDVSEIFFVGLLRPQNEKRFCRKSEHLYRKFILPQDLKLQLVKKCEKTFVKFAVAVP